jgi:hypothetical protein
MGIIEKIQEKTREEYLSILKLWIARLSGAIQQKPLQFFAAGVLAGMFLVMLARLLFPIILLGGCLAIAIYFIAPEKRI